MSRKGGGRGVGVEQDPDKKKGEVQPLTPGGKREEKATKPTGKRNPFLQPKKKEGKSKKIGRNLRLKEGSVSSHSERMVPSPV